VLGAAASKSALKRAMSRRASTGGVRWFDQEKARSSRGSSIRDMLWMARLKAAARGASKLSLFFSVGYRIPCQEPGARDRGGELTEFIEEDCGEAVIGRAIYISNSKGEISCGKGQGRCECIDFLVGGDECDIGLIPGGCNATARPICSEEELS
jgi:hypothetical protein